MLVVLLGLGFILQNKPCAAAQTEPIQQRFVGTLVVVAALGFAALKVWKSPDKLSDLSPPAWAHLSVGKESNSVKMYQILLEKNGWKNSGKSHFVVFVGSQDIQVMARTGGTDLAVHSLVAWHKQL